MDVMARFWRGEITERKLGVLVKGLPQTGPHSRHRTDGVEYGIGDSLQWILLWNLMHNNVLTAKQLGDKKAKMPADKMPTYPWTKPDKGHGRGLSGDLGDYDQGEVLDWLDNL